MGATFLYHWNLLIKKTLLFTHRHSRSISAVSMGIFLSLMGWQIASDWDAILEGYYASINPALALISTGLLIPIMLLVSMRWWLTLRLMHVHTSWRDAVQIWFLSQASRYLPGGIWPYLGRFLLSRGSIDDGSLVTGMVLETVLRVVSEVMVFLVSFPFWFHAASLDTRWIGLLVTICGAGLCLLHPAVLNKLRRIPVLRRSSMGSSDLSQLRYGSLLLLLIYYISTVVIVGSAFYLLTVAFYPLPIQFLPAMCGALSLAVVVGFLVLFVPNGWGVREAILAFLLAQLMPWAAAVLLAGVTRLWLTVGEGVWILGILGYRAISRPSSRDTFKKLLRGN